jgi:Zn-finger nucleic acid-binding protein
MALRCPKCRVSLHAVANRTGIAAVCARCGGLWLDNASSRSVLQDLVEPAVQLAAQQAALGCAEATPLPGGGYRARAPRPLDDAALRACASCDAVLIESTVRPAGVTLDVCAAHGTWFDAGELWAITQQRELAAMKDEEEVRAFGRKMETYRADDPFRDLGILGMLMGYPRRSR